MLGKERLPWIFAVTKDEISRVRANEPAAIVSLAADRVVLNVSERVERHRVGPILLVSVDRPRRRDVGALRDSRPVTESDVTQSLSREAHCRTGQGKGKNRM